MNVTTGNDGEAGIAYIGEAVRAISEDQEEASISLCSLALWMGDDDGAAYLGISDGTMTVALSDAEAAPIWKASAVSEEERTCLLTLDGQTLSEQVIFRYAAASWKLLIENGDGLVLTVHEDGTVSFEELWSESETVSEEYTSEMQYWRVLSRDE